jgi:hypothetical protein
MEFTLPMETVTIVKLVGAFSGGISFAVFGASNSLMVEIENAHLGVYRKKLPYKRKMNGEELQAPGLLVFPGADRELEQFLAMRGVEIHRICAESTTSSASTTS